MKIIRSVLFVLLVIGVSPFCYAHPLDVSNTTMSIYDNYVMGVTYIHPVELDRILISTANVKPMDIGVDTYYSLVGTLTKYLSETIELQNSTEKCSVGEYSFQEGLMIDEIFSAGFPISYIFRCSSKIIDPIITINFMTEIPLQTNRLYVYRAGEDKVMKRTDYRILNARKTTHSLSFTTDAKRLADTDNDGLTDEDELIYRTNPSLSDTDSDGYSDGLEINKSWDPLSPFLSPGQNAADPNISQYPSDNESTSGALHSVSLSESTGVWGSTFFAQVLRDIRLYVDREVGSKTMIFLFFTVMSLGFFHALGPGHSKGVLIAQIIDEHMNYSRIILYCAIFTGVHLLDIIVVVLLSKVFFQYLDSGVYLAWITRVSAVAVISVGGYLLLTSTRRFLSHNATDAFTKTPQKKNVLFLAIITGLTPCAFGWSIFLMLLAIGKSSLALPLLGALGIGIFLCLFLIATVTWYSRTKIYLFSPKIPLFSPIISSFCVLGIGIGLMLQNF